MNFASNMGAYCLLDNKPTAIRFFTWSSRLNYQFLECSIVLALREGDIALIDQDGRAGEIDVVVILAPLDVEGAAVHDDA